MRGAASADRLRLAARVRATIGANMIAEEWTWITKNEVFGWNAASCLSNGLRKKEGSGWLYTE